jgi:serine/threonine protein kinase
MKQSLFGGITFCCGDRYQLIKLIGTGSYGAVVLANDLHDKSKKVPILNPFRLLLKNSIKSRMRWMLRGF